jgi:hypothetical protein
MVARAVRTCEAPVETLDPQSDPQKNMKVSDSLPWCPEVRVPACWSIFTEALQPVVVQTYLVLLGTV